MELGKDELQYRQLFSIADIRGLLDGPVISEITLVGNLGRIDAIRCWFWIVFCPNRAIRDVITSYKERVDKSATELYAHKKAIIENRSKVDQEVRRTEHVQSIKEAADRFRKSRGSQNPYAS